MRIIFFFLITLLLATSDVKAQSLNDQVALANDAIFIQRVRQSMILAAVNISADGLTTGINVKRHALAQSIMNNPDGYKQLFSEAVATQPSAIGPATVTGTVVLKPMICTGQPTPPCVETGNVDAQQALVTDAVISNSVLFVYNAFFGGQ
jgi:hypothetical protein